MTSLIHKFLLLPPNNLLNPINVLCNVIKDDPSIKKIKCFVMQTIWMLTWLHLILRNCKLKKKIFSLLRSLVKRLPCKCVEIKTGFDFFLLPGFLKLFLHLLISFKFLCVEREKNHSVYFWNLSSYNNNNNNNLIFFLPHTDLELLLYNNNNNNNNVVTSYL